MTIFQAMALGDRLRPNELDPALKLRWLSTLDGQIHAELICGHEATGNGQETGGEAAPGTGFPAAFRGYDGSTELQSTQLLVAYPYDELYVVYLVMRIDLEHGELDRYNNSAARFNQLWRSFAAGYCRSRRPKGAGQLKF
jgi:hypothetical protein